MPKCTKCQAEVNEYELIDGLCEECFFEQHPGSIDEEDVAHLDTFVSSQIESERSILDDTKSLETDEDDIFANIDDENDTLLSEYGTGIFFIVIILIGLNVWQYYPKLKEFQFAKQADKRWSHVDDFLVDYEKNLVWQDNSEIRMKKASSWILANHEAKGYCNALQYDGVDNWRLPMQGELYDIAKKEVSKKFNHIKHDLYISATTHITGDLGSVYVDFKSGETIVSGAKATYIRCVHDSSASEISNLAKTVRIARDRIRREKERIAKLEKQCETGKDTSCITLGDEYYDSKEYRKAYRLYSSACNYGNSEGCYYVGLMLSSGEGTQRDYDRSAEYIKKACNMGSGKACTVLGEKYHGFTAAFWFEKACKHGDKKGCDRNETYHTRFIENGLPKAALNEFRDDLSRSKSRYSRSHAAMAFAIDNMGRYVYASRYGFDSAKKAYERILTECNNKNKLKTKCILYAVDDTIFYKKSNEDLEKFKSIADKNEKFRSECQNDNAESCLKLGDQLCTANSGCNHGTHYYRQACDLGNMRGCLQIGDLYEKGTGTSDGVDYQKARYFYQKACKNNLWQACSRLGKLHENTSYEKHDYFMASLFYQKACGHGDQSGCDLDQKLQKNHEVRRVPKKVYEAYEELKGKNKHTALAVAVNEEGRYYYASTWRYSSANKAFEKAMKNCEKRSDLKTECKIYSVDGDIVYRKGFDGEKKSWAVDVRELDNPVIKNDRNTTSQDTKQKTEIPAVQKQSEIVNINFNSKNITKNKTSKEYKVGDVSYKLKTVTGKLCTADKFCREVTLTYPVGLKANTSSIIDSINTIVKKTIPSFNPDEDRNYLKIMGFSEWGEKMSSTYDYDVSLKIISATNRTFSIEKCSGGYTGGAHAYGGCQYFNYDRKTNKKFTLDDVLRPDTKSQLMRVIERQFRKVNNLSSRESMTKIGLFENKLEKPDGFYVTNQGLHFYYSAGTIAPYGATGSYTGSFDVPYSLVAEILKPDGVLGLKSKKVDNSRQSISSFLHAFVNVGNSSYSPSDALRYYASFVHPYFGIRNATHQDILRDKQKYYRKWPERNYRLAKYTVVDQFHRAGQNHLELILEIDWRVASPKRGERTGHSVVAMTLVEDGDSYKITAVHNAHIQRNIPVRSSSTGQISFSPDRAETAQTYSPIYFSSNGIEGKMVCKRVESYKTCTVTATNHVGTGKGGISISFPKIHYRSSDIVLDSSRGFNTTNFYSSGSMLWSTQYGRKISANYLLLEGWAKRWRQGATKSISFSLGSVDTPVQVRAVVVRRRREYIVPTDFSTTDQQGYPVKVLNW